MTREVLDFSEPVALILVAILHFIPDADEPGEILSTLLGALPAGSYLVAAQCTAEHNQDGAAEGERTYQTAGIPMALRDSDVFARLAFSGLDLVPPGVVLLSEWRRDEPGPAPLPHEVNGYGGVARKR